MKLKENPPASPEGVTASRTAEIRKILGRSGDRLPTAEEVGAKPSVVPVLAVTKSFRLWNRIKWPLLGFLIVVVLLVVWIFTSNFYVEREIEKGLALVKFNEYTGELIRLNEAEKKLVELNAVYPKWGRVNTVYAWHLLLRAELFGPKKALHQKARQMIARGVRGDSEEGLLNKGISQFLDKKFEDCKKTAAEALRLHPDAARFVLLRALALSESVSIATMLEAAKADHVKHEAYHPLVLFAVKTASEKGSKSQTLRWTRKLLAISPNHVFGKLLFVEARLPNWGGALISRDKLNALADEVKFLRTKYVKDSPVAEQLTKYLEGRFAYHNGQLAKARAIFSGIIEKNPDPRVLVWLGQTIYEEEGPDAVLAMLEAHGDFNSQELGQLKATCLLAHHRVTSAEKLVTGMKKAASYRDTRAAKTVDWLLAIRKGEVNNALDLLPEIVRPPYQWAALELYWQLKARGDEKGINQVIASLDRAFSTCASAMETWHQKRSRKLMKIYNSDKYTENACIQAMGAHALRGYLPVEDVAKAVSLASREAGSENAWIETDRAVIAWMQQGQAAAVQILEGLLERKPEGRPLLNQIARSFLTIGMPERAHGLVAPCETPEAIDICIRALRSQGQHQEAETIVKKALALAARTEHPALYPHKLEVMLARRPSDTALSNGKLLARTAGAWATESIEHYITALAKRGETDTIDLFFQRVPNSLAPSAGLDVVWKIKEYGMQYTLSRGKRFRKRAEAIIDEMGAQEVQSARLYYGLGLAKLVRNNAKAAEKWFKEALRYDPTLLQVYGRLQKMGRLGPEMKSKLTSCYPALSIKSLR